MTGRRGCTTAAWALAAALAAAATVAPKALVGGWLSPDSIEHLAIARAWSEGAGFVDPVQWHYHLERTAPLPAAAARPPVVPMLLAIPLAAGATVPTVIVLHAAWSALVAAAAFLLAARSMRPAAAAAAALLLATMPAWATMATNPLTEVTATAGYLLVLATADGVGRSTRGALSCAAATVLAALTRPNLGAVAVAVVTAAVWEVGPRAALRQRSLWVYGLAFAGGMAAIDAVLRATTGEGLYAAYGVVTELLSLEDAWHYDRKTVGGWPFVQAHAEEIGRLMQLRASQLHEGLFVSTRFHRVGWLAVPAVAYGLFRRRDGVLAHRIDAFAILGFAVLVVIYYTSYARERFPLPIAVPACLTGLALVDAGTRRIAGAAGRIAGLVPLAIVLTLWASTPTDARTPTMPAAWRRYQVARRNGPVRSPMTQKVQALCTRVHPDAVVAASDPWRITFWCGNATVRLPIDPVSAETVRRFVAERRPGYVLLDQRRRPSIPENTTRWRVRLDRAQRSFERIPTPPPFILYRVVDAPPGSRPWRAAPPVACAGLGPGCSGRAAAPTRIPR